MRLRGRFLLAALLAGISELLAVAAFAPAAPPVPDATNTIVASWSDVEQTTQHSLSGQVPHARPRLRGRAQPHSSYQGVSGQTAVRRLSRSTTHAASARVTRGTTVNRSAQLG